MTAKTIHVASQVATVLLLFAGTFLFGIFPVFVQRNLLSCNCVGPTCEKKCSARKGRFITTFLIYLGGGVLLATCFIHLLPEAREGFEKYTEAKENMLRDSDLSTTMMSDESLFAWEQNDTLLSLFAGEQNDTLLYTTKAPESEDEEDHEHFPIPEFVVCWGFFAVYLLEEILHFFLGGHSHIPTETRAIRSFSRSSSCCAPCPGDPAAVSEDPQEKGASDQNSIVVPMEVQGRKRSRASSAVPVGFSVSGLLTVAALSFHSLFEGFAIGMQKTDKGIWILFSAIAVHKFVIAFVVGLEVLASGGRERLVYIYMLVFASMSPLGMAIAMITERNLGDGPEGALVEGILNAIATGTLLYVTFCEILQGEENHENLTGWQQLLATFIGFMIMCLVQYGSTFA